MFKSFSFMPKEIDIAFYYEVWEEIQALKWYFYKFAGVNADEAMQRTLMHTLMHFQSERGNLSAYVKILAIESTKDNSKLVLVDFLEQTLASDDEEMTPTVDVGRVNDFSSDVIEEMELSVSRRTDVVNLALEFMDKFITLCEALIRHDTSTKYYPEVFIKQCLKINDKCTNFNRLCLDLYMEYSDDFQWFLDLVNESSDVWKESDFLLISNNKSKRVKMINPDTGLEVEDADNEDWQIVGKLGEGDQKKHILRVHYEDVWEMMCDLVDSTETNEMKFIIDNSYIIRTFGGSTSVLNTDLYNEYDLIRNEILTNILLDTNGRILNVGSENIYLLCNAGYQIRRNKRTVCGHTFEFKYEDITDTIP